MVERTQNSKETQEMKSELLKTSTAFLVKILEIVSGTEKVPESRFVRMTGNEDRNDLANKIVDCVSKKGEDSVRTFIETNRRARTVSLC